MAIRPRTEYALGPPAAARTVVVSKMGLPIIELRPVRLPVYLDTTDLIARKGSEIVVSRTGRWSERLSVGVTRSLAASLTALLPCLDVAATTPIGQPVREILVDIDAFETGADRQVVLTARWTLTNKDGHDVLQTERVSIIEPAANTGDRAVVAAMSRAVEDLASHISVAIATSLPTGS